MIRIHLCVLAIAFAAGLPFPLRAEEKATSQYFICVSNEKSGDVTIIDGTTRKPLATIPVGPRPRGIHASPDGRYVYAALTGTPPEGPPSERKPAAAGATAAAHREEADRDKPAASNQKADGIAVIDFAARKYVKTLPAGRDPEQFAV